MKLPKVLAQLRSLDVEKQTGSLSESVEKWWKMKNVKSDMQAATLKYWEMSMNFIYKTLDKDKKLSDAGAVVWWLEEVKGKVSNNYANNLLGLMRGVIVVRLVPHGLPMI